MPQLVVFAEGTTSNGKAILKFKKGGFYPLTPVLPIFIKYNGLFCLPSFDTLPMLYHVKIRIEKIDFDLNL